MPAKSLILIAAVCLTGLLPAQQAGGINRNYIINSQGSFATSLTTARVNAGAPATMDNVYNTTDPLAPVIWAVSPVANPGQFFSGTNWIDIGTLSLLFSDVVFLVDGTTPGLLSTFFTTDAWGNFSFSLPLPSAVAGATAYFAMLHVSPTSPEGYYISQTHQVDFVPVGIQPAGSVAPNPAASPVTLGDDASVPFCVSCSPPIPYYGVMHTLVYVGSNGYVTFGTPDTSFTPSAANLLTRPPRISGFWTDFRPNAGQGSVAVYIDATHFEVTFTDIPEFNSAGANTFKMTYTYPAGGMGGLVTLDYGSMTWVGNPPPGGGTPPLGGLVGVSPGNNLTMVANLFDLTAAPAGGNPIPAGEAAYELFDTLNGLGNPNDLERFQVNFTVDGGGTPTVQW